jgi:hypothetical protein
MASAPNTCQPISMTIKRPRAKGCAARPAAEWISACGGVEKVGCRGEAGGYRGELWGQQKYDL